LSSAAAVAVEKWQKRVMQVRVLDAFSTINTLNLSARALIISVSSQLTP
jgi:hypothetical protein